jgi:hypothetical protein
MKWWRRLFHRCEGKTQQRRCAIDGKGNSFLIKMTCDLCGKTCFWGATYNGNVSVNPDWAQHQFEQGEVK